jgi:hypothetical protein
MSKKIFYVINSEQIDAEREKIKAKRVPEESNN